MAAIPENDAAANAWRGDDGTPVACRDKLRVLEENAAELGSLLRDVFDDALLMGVGESQMRAWLHRAVDALKSPLS